VILFAAMVASASAADPFLTYLGFLRQGDNNTTGLAEPYSITISSDGDYLYNTSTRDSSIGVFKRDQATGLLDQVQAVYTNPFQFPIVGSYTSQPTLTRLSPDEENLYCPLTDANALMVFDRNPLTGQLSLIQSFLEGREADDAFFDAVDLALTPDGEHLYLVSFSINALVFFNRELTSGTLSLQQVYHNGENGIQNFLVPVYTHMSNDGNYLYVACYDGGAIVVFSIDPVTGVPTYAGAAVNGVNGVQDMSTPRWIVASPDDRFLYVNSAEDHAVVLLERDEATGLPSFVASYKAGEEFPAAFGYSRASTVSPNGLWVASVSYPPVEETPGYVVISERNDTTGELTVIDSFEHDPGDVLVPGRFSPRDLRFSPDNNFLYIASWYEFGIAIYQRTASITSADPSWALYE
jgi:6-phosphogluconolactonase (cycloisomerase 2 family)